MDGRSVRSPGRCTRCCTGSATSSASRRTRCVPAGSPTCSIATRRTAPAWFASGSAAGTSTHSALPVPAHLQWQPQLWRLVRDVVGLPSPALTMEQAIDDLAGGRREVDLPPRLHLVGLASLPPAHLDVLAAIAQQRDVEVFAPAPSLDLWHRLVPAVARWAAAAVPARERSDGRRFRATVCSRAGGGRRARRTRSSSTPLGAAGTEPAAQPPGVAVAGLAPDLLTHLQVDLRHDVEPGELLEGAFDFRHPLARNDRSVQWHRCHGIGRQVEVLRDVLAHLLEQPGTPERPALEPRDIVVLCPDVATRRALGGGGLLGALRRPAGDPAPGRRPLAPAGQPRARRARRAARPRRWAVPRQRRARVRRPTSGAPPLRPRAGSRRSVGRVGRGGAHPLGPRLRSSRCLRRAGGHHRTHLAGGARPAPPRRGHGGRRRPDRPGRDGALRRHRGRRRRARRDAGGDHRSARPRGRRHRRGCAGRHLVRARALGRAVAVRGGGCRQLAVDRPRSGARGDGEGVDPARSAARARRRLARARGPPAGAARRPSRQGALRHRCRHAVGPHRPARRARARGVRARLGRRRRRRFGGRQRGPDALRTLRRRPGPPQRDARPAARCAARRARAVRRVQLGPRRPVERAGSRRGGDGRARRPDRRDRRADRQHARSAAARERCDRRRPPPAGVVGGQLRARCARRRRPAQLRPGCPHRGAPSAGAATSRRRRGAAARGAHRRPPRRPHHRTDQPGADLPAAPPRHRARRGGRAVPRHDPAGGARPRSLETARGARPATPARRGGVVAGAAVHVGRGAGGRRRGAAEGVRPARGRGGERVRRAAVRVGARSRRRGLGCGAARPRRRHRAARRPACRAVGCRTSATAR